MTRISTGLELTQSRISIMYVFWPWLISIIPLHVQRTLSSQSTMGPHTSSTSTQRSASSSLILVTVIFWCLRSGTSSLTFTIWSRIFLERPLIGKWRFTTLWLSVDSTVPSRPAMDYLELDPCHFSVRSLRSLWVSWRSLFQKNTAIIL